MYYFVGPVLPLNGGSGTHDIKRADWTSLEFDRRPVFVEFDDDAQPVGRTLCHWIDNETLFVAGQSEVMPFIQGGAALGLMYQWAEIRVDQLTRGDNVREWLAENEGFVVTRRRDIQGDIYACAQKVGSVSLIKRRDSVVDSHAQLRWVTQVEMEQLQAQHSE